MVIYLLVTAVLAALVAPSNRLISFFLVLVIFTVIAGNIENPDRANYLMNFDGIQSGGYDYSFEPGYQALAFLAACIGLDYGAFHFLLTAVALILITRTVIDLTNRPALAMFAYVCFPFFWDVTQVRNFYAMSIVMYGMRYILVEHRTSMTKYVFAISCASLFHITSLFYLLFLLARIRNKVILWCALGFGALIYISLFSSIVSSPLLSFLSHKIDVYTTTETSLFTKSSVLAYYYVSLVMLWWASRRLGASSKAVDSGVMALTPFGSAGNRGCGKISSKVLLNINFISGFSILLAMDNLDFIRLYRNIFLINCIYIINAIYARVGCRWLMFGCFMFYAVFTFVGFVLVSSSSNIVEVALIYNAINY